MSIQVGLDLRLIFILIGILNCGLSTEPSLFSYLKSDALDPSDHSVQMVAKSKVDASCQKHAIECVDLLRYEASLQIVNILEGPVNLKNDDCETSPGVKHAHLAAVRVGCPNVVRVNCACKFCKSVCKLLSSLRQFILDCLFLGSAVRIFCRQL